MEQKTTSQHLVLPCGESPQQSLHAPGRLGRANPLLRLASLTSTFAGYSDLVSPSLLTSVLFHERRQEQGAVLELLLRVTSVTLAKVGIGLLLPTTSPGESSPTLEKQNRKETPKGDRVTGPRTPF